MYIETERTPNPQTLKFLPGQTVSPSRGRSASPPPRTPPCRRSPTALFGLGDVEGVFFGSDFVSVNKAEGSADWAVAQDAGPRRAGRPFQQRCTADDRARPPPPPVIDDDPEDADIVAQIIDLLDTRVRPQVANDGGDIIYRGFNRGVVSLQMQGACSGCPSSTATLKGGIESLLKYYVPEVIEVRAV